MSDTQPQHASPADEGVDTSALERAEESIDEARDALAGVDGNDVSTGDDDAEGIYSEDPGEAEVNADHIADGEDD